LIFVIPVPSSRAECGDTGAERAASPDVQMSRMPDGVHHRGAVRYLPVAAFDTERLPQPVTARAGARSFLPGRLPPEEPDRDQQPGQAPQRYDTDIRPMEAHTGGVWVEDGPHGRVEVADREEVGDRRQGSMSPMDREEVSGDEEQGQGDRDDHRLGGSLLLDGEGEGERRQTNDAAPTRTVTAKAGIVTPGMGTP
jgi:hypothetical protein